NIGGEEDQSTTTDIDLGEGGAGLAHAEVIDLGQEAAPSLDDTAAIEAAPDVEQTISFNVDLPATPEPAPAPEPEKSGGLDFDIDLNSFNATAATPAAVEPEAAPAGGNALDFDMSGLSLGTPAAEPRMEAPAAAPEIDLSGISLDLGGDAETSPRISASGKDDHWYDVQTKFDLAKAYQEMGDKDGAREILKEVLQEGDAEQKTAAQAVLASLDA
ncbi:MAG TPA: FimV/HubP family polar landmark protein, partial [Burkholderiales bacterium]|nr:FimV/HubP family polar landmark protein [Burkholderiales bacterium]